MDERGGFFPSQPEGGFPAYGSDQSRNQFGGGEDFSVDLMPTEILPEEGTGQASWGGQTSSADSGESGSSQWGVPVSMHADPVQPWGREAAFGGDTGSGFGAGFGQNESFGRGGGFGQNEDFGQETGFGQGGFGQDNGFGQGGGFGQDNSFDQGGGFGQNSGFGQGGGFDQGSDFDQGGGFGQSPDPDPFAVTFGGSEANGFSSWADKQPQEERRFTPPENRNQFEVRLDEPEETMLFLDDAGQQGGTFPGKDTLGWGEQAGWGGQNVTPVQQPEPQPAPWGTPEPQPQATGWETPAEPEPAPAPVAEEKPSEQPAAEEELSAEDAMEVFAEHSRGWGQKKTWGSKSTAPAEPEPKAETPAEPEPAPVAEVKPTEQPAAEEEISAEDAMEVFAEHSRGWGQKKTWGSKSTAPAEPEPQAEPPVAPEPAPAPVAEVKPAEEKPAVEETPSEQPAAEEEINIDDAMEVFAEHSRGWGQKKTWGSKSIAPAEPEPQAETPVAPEPAPAPVAEVKLAEEKPVEEKPAEQPAAEEEINIDDAMEVFAEHSRGWGQKKTWGSKSTAPVEPEPKAEIPAESEPAPAPVAEVKPAEEKPVEQPAAEEEISAEDAMEVFAEHSRGWGQKKTWGSKSTAPAEPEPQAETPAEPQPAPAAEVKPAEEKPSEQPAAEEEINLDDAMEVFAEHSRGWGQKKTWGSKSTAPAEPEPQAETPVAPEPAPAPVVEVKPAEEKPVEEKPSEQPAAEEEINIDDAMEVFAEHSRGWGQKKTWGSKSTAPAEPEPKAETPTEPEPAPAPVAEVKPAEEKPVEQPAAEEEINIDDAMEVFAEHSRGWGQKKTWGSKSTAPAEPEPKAETPTELQPAPAPVAEVKPAEEKPVEEKPAEQPAAEDEISAEEAMKVLATNSRGWKRKKVWGGSEAAEATPQQEETPSSAPEETTAPAAEEAAPAADKIDDDEVAEVFQQPSGSWKHKDAWGGNVEAVNPFAKRAAAEQEASMKQPEEKAIPQQEDAPEEEPQKEAAAFHKEAEVTAENIFRQNRHSVFGRGASDTAAAGRWSAFRKKPEGEESNPFANRTGESAGSAMGSSHGFAAAARRAQEQQHSGTRNAFGKARGTGSQGREGSSWQGWGKHSQPESSAEHKTAGSVFGHRSGLSYKEQYPQQSAPDVVICPECGARNPAGANFCCMCRASLKQPDETVCPSCGKKLKPGIRFCPFCGTEF